MFLISFEFQGRQKQIKVGWDNFKIHFIANEKGDKIKILVRKTIGINI